MLSDISIITEKLTFGNIGYPKFGVRSLQYNLEMCQNAFKRFEGYYTSEELERQVQLTNSKARFLEFAQLLVDYREEVQG